MANFTYDITTTDGKVRRRIGDTVEGNGILPNSENFAPDEISYFLTAEGDHIMKAAAAAMEAAAAAWASRAGTYRLGPESDEQRQSDALAKRALTLRDRFGYTSDENSAGFSVQAETQ